jgi:hypothetical protein
MEIQVMMRSIFMILSFLRERPAFFNSVKADLHNVLVLVCIFFNNILTQINIRESQFPLLIPFPQLRENLFDNVIPFGLHVIECTDYKDSDSLPEKCHGLFIFPV